MAKKTYNINMEFLGVSRKKPQVGDIFVYKNKYKGYGWGRVIKVDTKLVDLMGKIWTSQGTIIYIYNVFTDNADKIPELKKNNLLIPPRIINRRGWLDGYFKNIANQLIKAEDRLTNHHFKSRVGENLRYYDEEGNRIVGITDSDVCGWYGVGNHRTLDDEISEALRLPVVPEN